MSFGAAEDNFFAAARHGIESTLFWPGMGHVPATELVLRRLLPLAQQGLDAWDVDPAISARLLGIIEGRCVTQRNGSVWQADAVRAFESRGHDRWEALRLMTLAYVERMHTNEPVHTWSPV